MRRSVQDGLARRLPGSGRGTPTGTRHSRGDYTPSQIAAIRTAVLIVLVVSWELYGRSVSEALFAPPSAIARAVHQLAIADGVLWQALATSVGALLVGFVASIVAGVTIGLVMGRFRTIHYMVDPYVSFFYALPIIVLVPLLLIWFGIGATLRVVLIFLAGIFPIIINTSAGVRQVDLRFIDVGRACGASERQILLTIILPATIPFVFAGIRIGFAQAFIAVIVAEMTATLTGLGGLIITSANFFRTDELFVPILAIMTTSVLLTDMLRRAHRRLAPWERSTGESMP